MSRVFWPVGHAPDAAAEWSYPRCAYLIYARHVVMSSELVRFVIAIKHPMEPLHPPHIMSLPTVEIPISVDPRSSSGGAGSRAEHPSHRPASISDFALDVDESAPVSSLDLPSTTGGPEHVRRRSELSHVQAPPAPADSIELATLAPVRGKIYERTNTAPSPPYAASLNYAQSEGRSSAAPTVSPAQRAKYRLNSRVQFAALCYSSFLQGWNDGSTGPLLPRIQRNYGVSIPTD